MGGGLRSPVLLPIYIIMSSIKIKKLTLQYSYLLLEKEEVDEIFLIQEKEIRAYIEKHYPDDYKHMFPKVEIVDSPPPKIIEEDLSEEREIKQKTKKNKDIRLLYRKIAEKTHPDKTGDNTYSGLFSEASLAYEEDDIATLLNLAGTLNIELIELSLESILLLENNINSIESEIVNKKTTTAWAFYLAENDEEKDQVVQVILNHVRSLQ